MGRHSKTVWTTDGLDRRANGYYSTPPFVAEFLAERMLALRPDGLTVLDPCVGGDEMAAAFVAAGKTVDGIDVVDFGGHESVSFRQGDFLLAVANWKRGNERMSRATRASPLRIGRDQTSAPWDYDYYIANPPYNCHEADYVRTHKAELTAAFGEVGIANTYALFLAALVDVAKPGALIGVLTLDSFLTAKLHAPLRKRILATCAIHLVVLCPTDLFREQRADVRTCLMILEKGGRQGPVVTVNRTLNTETFRKTLDDVGAGEVREGIAAEAPAPRVPLSPGLRVPLSEILLSGPKDKLELVVGCPSEVRALFARPRLGSLFRCATGISTGNDRAFVRTTPEPGHDVPFYKNPGSRRFRMDPDGYLPTDFLALADRHANFQVRNRDLLFKPGIACSSMGVPFAACRLPAGATFGVNANVFPDEADRDWLLAYLNSSLVTFFVRGVLLRTNMITSGYVARIPVMDLDAGARASLARSARKAVAQGERPGTLASIDAIVNRAAGLSVETVNTLAHFRRNIVRAC